MTILCAISFRVIRIKFTYAFPKIGRTIEKHSRSPLRQPHFSLHVGGALLFRQENHTHG